VVSGCSIICEPPGPCSLPSLGIHLRWGGLSPVASPVGLGEGGPSWSHAWSLLNCTAGRHPGDQRRGAALVSDRQPGRRPGRPLRPGDLTGDARFFLEPAFFFGEARFFRGMWPLRAGPVGLMCVGCAMTTTRCGTMVVRSGVACASVSGSLCLIPICSMMLLSRALSVVFM
jgi:hypothetical protein